MAGKGYYKIRLVLGESCLMLQWTLPPVSRVREREKEKENKSYLFTEKSRLN